MAPEQLLALLETITGHLHTASETEEQSLHLVQEQIASSLINQAPDTVSNQQFSFAGSDFFFRQNIQSGRLAKLGEIVTKTLQKETKDDYRVFIRDVPVRTTQVKGSVPDWAAGANPIKSIGPFLNKEGRKIWVDLFKVEKLIALYIQGQTAPVILFNSEFRETLAQKLVNAHVELVQTFNILPGSVWINAHALAASAPADRFVGLKVKGGTITLAALPFLQGTQLTVASNININIALQLDQKTDDDAGVDSPYGKDARNAKYQLPAVFNFSLNGNSKNITAINDASCTMYGQSIQFNWGGDQSTLFEPSLSRILIPWNTDVNSFDVSLCESPFCIVSGSAAIMKSWWALPAATIDITAPLQADSNGAVLVQCDKGLRVIWSGMKEQDLILSQPYLLGEPGRIGITDLLSDGLGASQHLDLWKDKINPHGTSVDLLFLKTAPFIFNTVSKGDELLFTLCNANVNADRPVKVNGEPFEIRSKNSLLALGANTTFRLIYLYDDNIIWDNTLPGNQVPTLKVQSIALENALFSVSPVNGCLLFGECDEQWKKVTTGNLFLTFGMYSYLPTLPDPYVANLNVLLRQFRGGGRILDAAGVANRTMWLWLICNVNFKPIDETTDDVKVSFHFGEMNTQPGGSGVFSMLSSSANANAPATNTGAGNLSSINLGAVQIPNYQGIWDEHFSSISNDAFALLDVSSNANQLGVSFGVAGRGNFGMVRTGNVVTNADGSTTIANTGFPFIVEGMEVKAQGQSVRAFMEPQVAWEPIFNLSAPDRDNPLDPNSPKLPMDPDPGFKYFANDGGPTRIFNNSNTPVALAPIPLVNFLFDYFKSDPKSILASAFTLPFGLKALGYITKDSAFVSQKSDPELENTRPEFRDNLQGGIQISVYSGKFGKAFANPLEDDDPMLPGYILQLNNLLEADGTAKGASNLGQRVSEIFNNEFFIAPVANSGINNSRGVPVKRIDFTGYGINTFSNWLSPSAALAQTSQARFDIMLGRTSHEVIQVKSIVYPWGIRVVRTITLFRTASGYVFRFDSGWKAQSDGKFDFSYKYKKKINPNGNENDDPKAPGYNYTEVTEDAPYEIHPGVVSGLFNVRNIKDAPSVTEYNTNNVIAANTLYLNGVKGKQQMNGATAWNEPVKCGAVYFDADIEIENVKQGHTNGRVVSKKILGYVQLAPAGKPLSKEQFRDLMQLQGGAIGADVDCAIDVNKSSQQMRLHTVDVNNSVDASNSPNNPIFVVAARGNVTLPKDGSWSMVQHAVGTGEVTPLPEHFPVPLIRVGKWIKDKVIDPNVVTGSLLRVANPKDILRNVVADTINFGYLQNTTTQKALFLTPSYGLNNSTLLSKTPPVFADAYRMMTGKGIFPNIGDAVTNFGKAMPMLNAGGVQAFTENALKDGGKKVLELLNIDAQKAGEEVIQQGLSLLKKGAGGAVEKALQFDVPDFDIPLVDMDALKVYVEYKTGKKNNPATAKSKLDFDINSATAESWKSRMNDLAMVVDLGPMKRLMTIKGNFNSKKGTETGYEGDLGGGGGIPTPEVEFSDELKPVIAILEMLAALSTGDYASALNKGLKVAMSNAGEVWEYKFEATKEIGLIRFPPTAELYNSPQTPLKLEASLSLGVYFDAALKVTTDPKQLLPTAGAFIQFHGGLQVMCFSLGVGTIFAIGTVDVRIGADTKVGPTLDLKFGFGAQIVVGFPVIANVSVTFMVGAEMHADASLIKVAAILYFRGHADILGGIVSITITIEAKGIIVRRIPEKRTDCSAQVTFALDISIFLIIDISFSKTWGEDRQIAGADSKYD